MAAAAAAASVDTRKLLERRFAKGLWHAETRVGDGEQFPVKELFVVPLAVGRTIRAGATSFLTGVDPARFEHVYAMGAVQLALAIAARVRECARASNAETYGGRHVRVFVETVVGDDSTVDERDAGTYGNTSEDVAQREFMRGVEDERPVVEYRIFVAVHGTTKLTTSAAFMALVNEHEKAFQAFCAPKAAAKERTANDVSALAQSYRGSGAAETMATSYGATVGPCEFDRHLRSLVTCARVFDCLMNRRTFVDESIIAAAERTRSTPDKNPLAPICSLSLSNYFYSAPVRARAIQVGALGRLTPPQTRIAANTYSSYRYARV